MTAMFTFDCWGAGPVDAGQPSWVETRMTHGRAAAASACRRSKADEWARGMLARWPPRAQAGPGERAAGQAERTGLVRVAKQPSSDERTVLDVAANLGGQPRFFSAHSPWNTKVPEAAGYAPIGGIGTYDVSPASWDQTFASVAVYYASSDDPLVNVRHVADSWLPVASGKWRRTGNSPEVEAGILAQSGETNPYPVNTYSTQRAKLLWHNGGAPSKSQYRAWVQSGPLRVRVPAGAVPPPESDGHMVVVQPDGRALELYSAVVLSDGTLVSQQYSFTDALGGMGVGPENGRRASMIPSYAGIITDMDMRRGRIEHALALLVPASMLTTAFVWPALAFDSRPNYTGTVPMGGRLALPPDIQVPNMRLKTDFGRMVARAAQDYGMYVVDRGGSGITVLTQHEPRSPALARREPAVEEDLKTIFRHAQLVRTQAPPAGAGGRTPDDARHGKLR